MKTLFLATIALMSASAFSQSYFILSNGVTLTLDKSGEIHDHVKFFLPSKVDYSGGQFFIAEGSLFTVDEKGFFYEKELFVNDVAGKGANYFINDDDELVTISPNGGFTVFDSKEDKKIFGEAEDFGGSFFTYSHKGDMKLATVRQDGTFRKDVVVPGLDLEEIKHFGGNWFMAEGVIYTIDKNGNIYSKSSIKVADIARKGGNFFMDASQKIYTVSEDGFLYLAALPMNFRLNSIMKIGSSYMFDASGRLFVVDSAGVISERQFAKHDLKMVKNLSF